MFRICSDSISAILLRHRTSRRQLACAIALLAVFCLLPSRAQASFTDDVIAINPSAQHVQNHLVEHAARPDQDRFSSCQRPQCRAGNSIPTAPPPAQIAPEVGVFLADGGQLIRITLLANSSFDNWSIYSEAHLLFPDPPPRLHF